MRKPKWLVLAAAMLAGTAFMAGCEDDNTKTHKITFHNKSSYTVTQRLSGYGKITIAPGSKRTFNDSSMTMYEYEPRNRVTRVKEDSHTVVYKNGGTTTKTATVKKKAKKKAAKTTTKKTTTKKAPKKRPSR